LRTGRIRREVLKLERMRRQFFARFAYPKLTGLPEGERILVLSPHPDDDVIGAGGTLSQHHTQGCHVTSIVLTDGEAGCPEVSTGETRGRRRAEARKAADLIGIDETVFLGEPDGGLAGNDSCAARIRDCLVRIAPHVVYLPTFLDNHPDHRATTALLAGALQGTALEFMCCAYETLTPLLPNILIDISEHMTIKLKAIAAHESQVSRVDYQDVVRGLNRYRTAQFSREIAFAEAFYASGSSEYVSFWKEIEPSGEVRY
jgi:LmbE family N-acetylglucosaminyl deacetylase